jgi:phosphoheptose isomerase
VDPLIQYLKKKKQVPVESDEVLSPEGSSRREVLKNLVGLPVLGLLGWSAFRSQKLYGADVMSGATIQVGRTELSALKGKLPIGKIGNQELSRLIMGGNLIGGYSHARDLKYTDTLFKAYNSEKKIFETLMLGEQAGINSINIGYLQMPVMAKYKKLIGSKIKVIVQVGIDDKNKDIYDNVTQAIDLGMDVLQLQGGWGDRLVRDHRVEVVGKMMERIRSEGYVAGLGAHDIETMITCEENGIIPDYYMQTMHHDNYWSAHPRENRKPFETLNGNSKDRNEYHDNLFCPFPERTVEFVNRAKVPVMGFKVLAAGAIKPKEGFNWAFKNGADFICVGMFDFQIVNDVNICLDVLQNLKNRQREWYA